MFKLKKAQHSILNFLGSASLCPVAVPEIFCSLSLTKFRPLPLRSLRFFCHWQRSATSPLRYLSVYMFKFKKAQHSILNFLGSASLCPVAVPEIFCSLSLTKFRPLPLRGLRFFCHWQRSATSPLRYLSV